MFKSFINTQLIANSSENVEMVDGMPLYLAATQSSSNPFFSVDPGIGLWVWVVFFATLLVLYRYAWKPILSALDEREARIANSIESAKKIEKNLQETEENTKRIFSEAQQKSSEILEASRKRANEIKEAIEGKAREEAENILSKARQTIENEKNIAITKLRKEATSLSISIASKIIDENLDNEKNRKLAEKYINQ